VQMIWGLPAHFTGPIGAYVTSVCHERGRAFNRKGALQPRSHFDARGGMATDPLHSRSAFSPALVLSCGSRPLRKDVPATLAATNRADLLKVNSAWAPLASTRRAHFSAR
jgi:hypothetical protein